MNIELKFSVAEVITISVLLDKYYEVPFNGLTVESKLEFSIGYVLSDIFQKKKRSLLKKQDLFNESKKIKITLKYHEAWGLKKILLDHGYLLNNHFQKTNVQGVINKLDLEK